MIRLRNILILFLLIGSACSSSKWVVENQYEIDRNDFELLSSDQFLTRVGSVSPQNPVIQFEIKSANTFEYTQRVRTDRYIQRYRPSFKSVLLGLGGASLATSAALLIDQPKSTQQALFGTAALVSLASFLNMNPTGNPTPTGEVRLLRRTGSVTETDTVSASPDLSTDISYTMYHDGEIVAFGDDLEYRNSRFTINLLESFNPEESEYQDDDVITVEIYFNEDIYVNTVPISSFLEQFVVIDTEVTALRDEPVLESRTILTDLAQGSQLRFVEEDNLWYKVLFGISETYVSKSDAYLIWRPTEFASQLSIVTVPNIPFGNIDVESDIPTHVDQNERSYGFVLANREYQGELSERNYAERDAQLMSAYLENAFSFRSGNIRTVTNVENQQQLVLAYNRLANDMRGDQKHLVVYVSGYVTSGESSEMLLYGTGGSTSSMINLNSFFSGISRLLVEELIILLDIDNIDDQDQILIEPLANQILENNPNSAIIVSSSETQRSRNYSRSGGEQKRHSIFSYFIADAIKQGATTVSEIVNHLQRNVDYTSRRLHNQPQHILFFGESGISLIE
ncbi:MAG: caspase family protein [Balneolaceae bacterium]|nr:caspase family protein [Balneolaceae bacterium]